MNRNRGLAAKSRSVREGNCTKPVDFPEFFVIGKSFYSRFIIVIKGFYYFSPLIFY